MPAPKRRGRPPKYATAEEREAARRRTKQDSYQRLRDAGREQRQQQQRPNDASTAQELQIQIDPLSILQQTGPGEDMHATASHTGTQMEGSAARDEGEQRQLLQVFICACSLPKRFNSDLWKYRPARPFSKFRDLESSTCVPVRPTFPKPLLFFFASVWSNFR